MGFGLLVVEELDFLSEAVDGDKGILVIDLVEIFGGGVAYFPLSVVDEVLIEPLQLLDFHLNLLDDDVLQLGDVGFLDHVDGHIDEERKQEVIEVVGGQRVHVGSDVSDDLEGQAGQ